MRPIVVACAAAVLAGCSLAPAYRVPELPQAATYQSAGEWTDAAPADQRPRDNWWSAFGHAELDSLESDLDRDSPDLAVALARYQEASALAAQAKAAQLPTVGLVGQDLGERQSDNRPLRSATQPSRFSDAVGAATASYELDLWGRVRDSARAGRAAAQAAADDLQSVRLLLHAELAANYIALRATDADLQLLATATQAYERALSLIQTRHDGGLASALDVARARAQLESARAEYTDVHAVRALYEHALATLAGKHPSLFSLPPAPLDLQPLAVPVGLPSQLLQQRPDVAAAERRMAALNAQIGIARAAYFPRLSLSAIVGFESTAAAGLLAAPNRYWAIGPQGAFTLFDAGARRAAVAAAQARFDAAAAQYRGTVLASFREVEDALSLTQGLHSERTQREAAREAADRAAELAFLRYREGAISTLEVITAQVAAVDAERSELAVRTRELQADVALVRAVGGGFNSEPDTSGPGRPGANLQAISQVK